MSNTDATKNGNGTTRLLIPVALLAVSLLANAWLASVVATRSEDHRKLQDLEREITAELPVIRLRLGNIEKGLEDIARAHRGLPPAAVVQ